MQTRRVIRGHAQSSAQPWIKDTICNQCKVTESHELIWPYSDASQAIYWKKGKIMHAVKGRKAMDSSDYFWIVDASPRHLWLQPLHGVFRLLMSQSATGEPIEV